MQDETYNQSVKDWWGIVSTKNEGFGSSRTRVDADRPVWAHAGIALSSPVGSGDPFGYGIPPFHRVAVDVISVENGNL
jgi:hypothetical protein